MLAFPVTSQAASTFKQGRRAMGPNKIFDQTSQLLEANLDRRVSRNRLISRNLANVDTPNFNGSGLEFETQLRQAVEGGIMPASLTRTHPQHLPQGEEKAFSSPSPKYKDIGAVHLDIEMSKLAENNIMFNAMVRLLNHKFNLLKTAISDSGGGR